MMQSSSSSEGEYDEIDGRGLTRRDVCIEELRGQTNQSLSSGLLASLSITNTRIDSSLLRDDETSSIASSHRTHSELLKSESRCSRQSNWEANKTCNNNNSGSTIRHPLTVRTSSLKGNQPPSSQGEDSQPEETQSLFPTSPFHLQAPFNMDDRTSLQSNWSSGQPSSVDLSSLKSYSVISVPVTFDRNVSSIVRQRPLTMLGGTSNSISGPMEGSSRFSSPIGRFDQPSLGNPVLVQGPSSVTTNNAAEELHKLRLQLYVFVLRCIAYPFTVALPQDPVRRYLKITNEYFKVLRERFTAFLNKDLQIVCDEAFRNAVQHFNDIFLNSDRISKMVKIGAFSINDIREVFIHSIEQRLIRFDEIDGLPKKTVIGAWKIKFDQICRGGEGPCPIANCLAAPQLELTNPTKEQLFDLFMRILSIKKYEHQILFNACQLDNTDEQAAQVRRELATKKSFLEEMAANRTFPKMAHKEMEVQYVEEQIANVNQLMLQLDLVPVGKAHGYQSAGSAVGVVVQLQRKLKRYSATANSSQDSQYQRPRATLNGTSEARNLSAAPPPGGGLLAVARPSIVAASWGEDLLGENTHTMSSINNIGNISKLSIQLSFHLEISICQLRPLRHLSGNKLLFCTIELEGFTERQRTASVKASEPIWDTVAEFESAHPLPCIKVKLLKESASPLSLDNKELGRIVLLPNPTTTRYPTWYKLSPTKNCNESLELQLAVRQERPSNLKYCGYCWVQGRTTFKKWKIRYICLIQVSQYTFIIAAFKEAKSIAYESMMLDGYTVDYCESNQELVAVAKAELATETGGLLSSSMPTLNKFRVATSGSCKTAPRRSKDSYGLIISAGCYRLPRHFFNVVREGDALTFAVSDEPELHGWVQAIHRATGQSHKPVPPARISSSRSHFQKGDRDRAQNLGMTELVSVKPHEVNHLPLLEELQAGMLEYRIKDLIDILKLAVAMPLVFRHSEPSRCFLIQPFFVRAFLSFVPECDPFVSLGWFSPAQKLILDEYCNRFGIRECQQHLIFLQELIKWGEQDYMIDMDLIHFSYTICSDHVQGKAQETGINTVLSAEMEDFQNVKTRLFALLEKKLTGFQYNFPFNRPDGGLEKLLTLMERVLCQSGEGAVASEAVRSVIHVCLRNAAVMNYEQISELAHAEAKAKEDPNDVGLPSAVKQLQNLLRLSEMCIDTLQQNEEYYAKSFIWFNDLFVEHSENFLSLFQMDMTEVLDNLPSETWGIFQIFQLLNGCLINSDFLANGRFHTSLLERFAPFVEKYLNLMETSITTSLINGIEKEKWIPLAIDSQLSESSDHAVGSSVSSQAHMDTDSESYRSLNSRKLLNHNCNSSPPCLLPSVVEDSRPLLSRVDSGAGGGGAMGPTSAFLDVLSRSRPLAFVSRRFEDVINPLHGLKNKNATVITSLVMDADENGEMDQPSDLNCSLHCARCCKTIATLVYRLHALKEFIAELSWPERVKAVGWTEKTRTMCSNLLREAAKRTLIELESSLRHANKSMEFLLPLECFTMINTITAIRMQLFSLCNRHESEVTLDAKQAEKMGNDSPVELSMSQPISVRMYTETEAFLEGVHRQMSVILTDNLVMVLSMVLSRLARYDEGNLISSLLTLTKPVDEDGKNYIQFIDANLQILCQNLVDEVYLLSVFENWYTSQLRLIHDWLVERRKNVLHAYQIKCLSKIVRKVFSDFELQGVSSHVLENMTYKDICHRLQVEEATLSVSSCNRDRSCSSDQSNAPDNRRNLMKAIGGGLSNLAQGARLRPRQS